MQLGLGYILILGLYQYREMRLDVVLDFGYHYIVSVFLILKLHYSYVISEPTRMFY